VSQEAEAIQGGVVRRIYAVTAVLLSLALILGSISCGTSGSSPDDALASDITPPSPPSNLAKTTPDTDSTPTFTWGAGSDEESGVSGYLVRIDDGYWRLCEDNATTYTCDTPLSDGGHTFQVRTVDEAGNGSNPLSLPFECNALAPVISAVETSAVDSRSANVTWLTDEPASSQVEFGLSASYGNTTAPDSAPVTSHNVTLTDLEPDTTYHYRVISEDARGNSASSPDFSFTTSPNPTPPASPSGLTLTPGYKEAQLDWSANSEADLAGYHIYRSDSADSGYVQLNSDPVTEASYLDTGLTPDTTYYYRISATNTYGNESLESEAATASTLDEAEAFPAYLGYGETVTTDSGPYETVESRIDNLSLRPITVNALEVLDQTDSRADMDAELEIVLNPGEGYSHNLYYPEDQMPDVSGWSVEWSCVDAEDADFTSVGMSTETDSTPPTISGVDASSISRTTATITWTTDEPATSQVEYGLATADGSTTTLDQNTVTSHEVTLAGLSQGTTYYFRLISLDAEGNESVSEDYSFTTDERRGRPIDRIREFLEEIRQYISDDGEDAEDGDERDDGEGRDDREDRGDREN
jgi:hypothetical protein